MPLREVLEHIEVATLVLVFLEDPSDRPENLNLVGRVYRQLADLDLTAWYIDSIADYEAYLSHLEYHNFLVESLLDRLFDTPVDWHLWSLHTDL